MYIYIFIVHSKVPYSIINLYVVVPWDMRRKSMADVSPENIICMRHTSVYASIRHTSAYVRPENIICTRIYRQYSYFCTRKQVLLYQ